MLMGWFNRARERISNARGRIHSSYLTRVYNAEYRAARVLVIVKRQINRVVATVLAAVLTIPLILFNELFRVADRADFHYACAGIIGGAMALILSLSIIPAQRAAVSGRGSRS